MLFVKRYSDHDRDRGPLLLMIHWLGGSSRSWTEVAQQLGTAGFRCLAVDLPGFGQSAEVGGYSTSQMASALVDTIRSLRKGEADRPWLIAGHSMGGKLAAIIARAAEQGEEGLENLFGMVLLSPSPPGPEPMQESKREEMLRALGPNAHDAEERRAHAEKFVRDNTGNLPLLDVVQSRSVDDVLHMNPHALVAWLTVGSKEDCSKYVGLLNLPTLIMAGSEEKALGPGAQEVNLLPHFVDATLVALEGCGHLGPLERPREVSDRMIEFFGRLRMTMESSESSLSADFFALIVSDQTSPQTREALLGRMEDKSDDAGVLSVEELRTLRALVGCVVPDAGFDLARRLDRALAQSRRDGWRFSALPEDGAAWKRGLASLDSAANREFAVPFIALHATSQDGLLKKAHQGLLGKGVLASLHLSGGAQTFDGAQMRDWFEDVRGELAKLYVGDPRTMQRIGFTGFADEQGFTRIRLGETEGVEA